jgi:hypothetical protein
MPRRRRTLPTLLLAFGALVLGQVAAQTHGLCSHDHGDTREGCGLSGAACVVRPSVPRTNAAEAAKSVHFCPLCVASAGHFARLPEACGWADASGCVGCIGGTVPEEGPRADVLGAICPRAPPGKLA